MTDQGVTHEELEIVKTEMVKSFASKVDATFARLARFAKAEELEAWHQQLLARESAVTAREEAVRAMEDDGQSKVEYWASVEGVIRQRQTEIADKEASLAELTKAEASTEARIEHMKEMIQLLRAEIHEVSREQE